MRDIMRKWIIGLLGGALLAVSGCAARSDNGYHLKIYDPSGNEFKTGMNLMALGSGIYTVRNAACGVYPGATLIFTDMQGKQLKPYKCGGKWQPQSAPAVSVGADLWEDEVWKKPGADKQAVRKGLMACGAPNPRPEIADMTDNQYMLMARCMEKSGFKNINGDKNLFQCKNYPKLAACTPGAVIPSPSAKRRLGSPWCGAHKEAPECRP